MKQLMLSLAIIAASCSSNSSDGHQRATNAPASAAARAAATPAEAAPATLAVYPGATKLLTQMRDAISFCGTKMTTVVYRVPDVNAQTVAAWYASHIAGGITVTIPKANDTVVEVFEPNGRAAAAISQMHFDPRLASAAKGLGADRTSLGIVTFDPPMSSDMIAMVGKAANGDTSAKAQLKAQCGQSAAR
jgi:hypothetical protein